MKLIHLAAALMAGALFVQGSQDAAPTRPAVGKPAPAFRLNDHLGDAVRIGGKSERWTVLAFFPKAMTPG